MFYERGVSVWGPSTVPLACTPCGGCAPRGWWGAVPWWRATIVRGVWCPWALSLPRSPALRGGQPGFRDPYAPGAVGAGVGTRHRPHSARPCELACRTVGLEEWRPQGGAFTVVRGVCGQAPPLSRLPALRAGCMGSSPTCCGRGSAGVGTQLGSHALWGLRTAGVVGGRPRGGWPATVVTGVWCQALSLPQPPILWGGQPGFRDPCAPGAVGAGVGTQHGPHSLRPCGPALHAVGVAEGHPRGGCLQPM